MNWSKCKPFGERSQLLAQISGYITTLACDQFPMFLSQQMYDGKTENTCGRCLFFIDAQGVGSVMKSPISIFYDLYGSIGVSYIKSYSCGRSVRLWDYRVLVQWHVSIPSKYPASVNHPWNASLHLRFLCKSTSNWGMICSCTLHFHADTASHVGQDVYTHTQKKHAKIQKQEGI